MGAFPCLWRGSRGDEQDDRCTPVTNIPRWRYGKETRLPSPGVRASIAGNNDLMLRRPRSGRLEAWASGEVRVAHPSRRGPAGRSSGEVVGDSTLRNFT